MCLLELFWVSLCHVYYLLTQSALFVSHTCLLHRKQASVFLLPVIMTSSHPKAAALIITKDLIDSHCAGLELGVPAARMPHDGTLAGLHTGWGLAKATYEARPGCESKRA